jgi:hypothetical protein
MNVAKNVNFTTVIWHSCDFKERKKELVCLKKNQNNKAINCGKIYLVVLTSCVYCT